MKTQSIVKMYGLSARSGRALHYLGIKSQTALSRIDLDEVAELPKIGHETVKELAVARLIARIKMKKPPKGLPQNGAIEAKGSIHETVSD